MRGKKGGFGNYNRIIHVMPEACLIVWCFRIVVKRESGNSLNQVQSFPYKSLWFVEIYVRGFGYPPSILGVGSRFFAAIYGEWRVSTYYCLNNMNQKRDVAVLVCFLAILY